MMAEQVYVKTRNEWREWLSRYHDVKKVVWLVYYKKGSCKPSIAYDDSVEEALCYGWVDSIIKRIDEEKYVRKFTPRKEGSKWSEANRKRVNKMIEHGRMTKEGMKKIKDAVVSGEWKKPKQTRSLEVPPYFKEVLAKNQKAQRYFEGLAPTYRRHFIGWVDSAKREETRMKRLAEAMSLLERGQKLGLK